MTKKKYPKQKKYTKNSKLKNQEAKVSLKNEVKIESKPITSKYIYLAAFIIAVLTFIAYIPSLDNDFTNWDDSSYASQNYQLEQLNWKGVKKQFSQYWMGNYHPLAMLSLAVDFHLAGKRKPTDPDNKHSYEPKPFVFHLHNLILHLLNTLGVYFFSLLLFKLFEQKFRANKKSYYFPMAVFTGLLFGLNAMHVESVAWVAERKDVLYTFYYILSLILYVKYLEKKKTLFFGLSLFVFLLSLLSKGQAVSLSITLIAIDIFLGRNWKNRKIWIEKIPFLLLSLIFGIIAIFAQKAGSAIHDIADFYFHERIIWASYGLFEYLWKLSIPIHLSPIYPYPYKSGQLPIVYWLYLLPAAAILASFYWAWRKNRLIAFGLGFFFINIFLLLQLLPVGSAVMADRYAYIPSIGYFMLWASLIPLFADKKINLKILYLVLTALSFFFGYQTFKQSDVWQNSMSIWNQTLKYHKAAVVAWNNRGSTKEKYKEHASAIKDFDQAIFLKPDYTHAYYNRGTAKKALAEETLDPKKRHALLTDAIDDFDKAIVLKPSFDQAFHNRGIVYDDLGKFRKALDDFNKAIQLKPKNPDPYINRGVVYGKLGKLDSSIADFDYAISIRKNDASAYSNRGLARNISGDTKGALEDYNKAIELDPSFATAYSNRGIIYKKLGKYQLALNDFSKALDLNPKFAEGYFQRGTVYIILKNRELGCKDFQLSYQLGFRAADKMIQKYCQ